MCVFGWQSIYIHLDCSTINDSFGFSDKIDLYIDGHLKCQAFQMQTIPVNVFNYTPKKLLS